MCDRICNKGMYFNLLNKYIHLLCTGKCILMMYKRRDGWRLSSDAVLPDTAIQLRIELRVILLDLNHVLYRKTVCRIWFIMKI